MTTRKDRGAPITAAPAAELRIPDHSPDIRAFPRSSEMYLLNEALSREHQRQLERSARERRRSRQDSSERRYRTHSARSS
jgi:hypothetical protein